jgi:hypothetical protein
MFDWGDSGWEFGVFFYFGSICVAGFRGARKNTCFWCYERARAWSVRYSVRKIETFQGQDR